MKIFYPTLLAFMLVISCNNNSSINHTSAELQAPLQDTETYIDFTLRLEMYNDNNLVDFKEFPAHQRSLANETLTFDLADPEEPKSYDGYLLQIDLENLLPIYTKTNLYVPSGEYEFIAIKDSNALFLVESPHTLSDLAESIDLKMLLMSGTLVVGPDNYIIKVTNKGQIDEGQPSWETYEAVFNRVSNDQLALTAFNNSSPRRAVNKLFTFFKPKPKALPPQPSEPAAIPGPRDGEQRIYNNMGGVEKITLTFQSGKVAANTSSRLETLAWRNHLISRDNNRGLLTGSHGEISYPEPHIRAGDTAVAIVGPVKRLTTQEADLVKLSFEESRRIGIISSYPKQHEEFFYRSNEDRVFRLAYLPRAVIRSQVKEEDGKLKATAVALKEENGQLREMQPKELIAAMQMETIAMAKAWEAKQPDSNKRPAMINLILERAADPKGVPYYIPNETGVKWIEPMKIEGTFSDKLFWTYDNWEAKNPKFGALGDPNSKLEDTVAKIYLGKILVNTRSPSSN